MSRAKTIILQFRAYPEQAERWEASARAERLTISNWMRKWLEASVEASSEVVKEKSYQKSDQRKVKLYGTAGSRVASPVSPVEELPRSVAIWVKGGGNMPDADYKHD